jgi:hypothetical protein
LNDGAAVGVEVVIDLTGVVEERHLEAFHVDLRLRPSLRRLRRLRDGRRRHAPARVAVDEVLLRLGAAALPAAERERQLLKKGRHGPR